MSLLNPLLSAKHVDCGSAAGSRKRVLQEIAQNLACEQLNEDQIFDGLMNRGRLGSTGLGDGVAIPHCRQSCSQMRVCLVTTQAPIDYEASDGGLVDIFFALVVPTEEANAHLEALADLSQVFSNAENRQRLRACQNDEELHDLMQRLLDNPARSSTA